MRKISYKIIMILLLVVVTIFTTTAVYAWRTYSSEAKKMALKVTKIDSVVYVYEGIDNNYNGIPDLLTDTSNANYPEDKRYYYQENKAFNYLGYKYALTTEPAAEEKVQYAINNVFPTMVSTLKMSILNNSDGINWVSFSFDQKSYSPADSADLKLLSCLSVRVGQVMNNTGNINSPATSVVFSDKYYFNDNITSNFDGFSIISGDDAVQVMGMIARDTTINNDVVDMWFQFEMEAYEDLVAHGATEGAKAFSMSQSDYNALQNKQITLPDLKVLLEVRV